MKQKLSLDDRIWLWMDKNPPTPSNAYWADKIPWICIGMLIAVLFIGSPTVTGLERMAYYAVYVAFVVGLAVVLTVIDKRKGYKDAIYQNLLKNRQAKKEKINAILAETKKE